MKPALPYVGLLWLGTALAAQSPLTTDLLGNTGFSGSNGIKSYFDLEVSVPLTVTSLDLSAYAVAGQDPWVRVWLQPGSYRNAGTAGWSIVSNGPLVALGTGVASACEIVPFSLPIGTYGVAVEQFGVGVRSINGNGTSVPGSGTNQTYATAEMILRGGALGGTGAWSLDNSCTTWAGRIHYSVDGAGVPATRAHYGTACEAAESEAFYQSFSPGTFDLANQSLWLDFTDAGYVGRQGTATLVPPTSAAVPLSFDGNGAATVALPRWMRVGRSRWSNSLVVFRHGYVSVAPATMLYSTGDHYVLDSPSTTWWCHHEFVPSATAPGQVLAEVVGAKMCITWDNVLDPSGHRSTFQMQFDTLTHDVHYVFGNMATAGGGFLVGFSESGTIARKVAVDISAAMGPTFAAGRFRTASLQLFTSDRPLVGTTLGLTVRRIPASASFGAVLVGLQKYSAGLSLGALGLPSCMQYVSDDATVFFLTGGLPTYTHWLPIPALQGVAVRAQAFIYAPSMRMTPLGAFGSEGIDLVIGDR